MTLRAGQVTPAGGTKVFDERAGPDDLAGSSGCLVARRCTCRSWSIRGTRWRRTGRKVCSPTRVRRWRSESLASRQRGLNDCWHPASLVEPSGASQSRTPWPPPPRLARDGARGWRPEPLTMLRTTYRDGASTASPADRSRLDLRRHALIASALSVERCDDPLNPGSGAPACVPRTLFEGASAAPFRRREDEDATLDIEGAVDEIGERRRLRHPRSRSSPATAPRELLAVGRDPERDDVRAAPARPHPSLDRLRVAGARSPASLPCPWSTRSARPTKYWCAIRLARRSTTQRGGLWVGWRARRSARVARRRAR